ncbi:hypothetical protein RUND412_000709 [Rhizina undulata]
MEVRRLLPSTLRSLRNPIPLRPFHTTATVLNTAPPKPRVSMHDLLGKVQSTSAAPARRLFPAGNGALGAMSRRNALNIPPPMSAADSERIPRIGPSAGRSVAVTGDLAQAFTRLRYIVTSNNVKYDERRQKFHERPGMKRKRLRSERHRKRFKAGFKRMIKVVLEMKKKGL